MGRRVVDKLAMERWREADAAVILQAVADHAKEDSSFCPQRSHGTTRWHANVAGTDYEVLCSGPKFFDTRAKLGGGGAVDLVMHLFKVDFAGALRVLREKDV